MAGLQGVALAMLGGDRRELELAAALVAQGARVRTAGLPTGLPELEGTAPVASVAAAVDGAAAIIAPMAGTDEDGRIKADFAREPLFLDRANLTSAAPGTPLLIGHARSMVRTLTSSLRLRLVELAELDEIAILNSIPTAEGAIALAMQELSITLHGSSCLVLGFGRCGTTLSRDLQALGARTIVAARDGAQRARALEMGLAAVNLAALEGVVADVNCIFNTIPALVLTRPIIARIAPDALVIDLASAPGGTDFTACRELGRKAILAPGLPGKVAPKSAGRILAHTVPVLIATLLAERDEGGEGVHGT